MKKICPLIMIIELAIILSGCGSGNNSKSGDVVVPSNPSEVKTNSPGNTSAPVVMKNINSCSEEKIPLPNYGDPGQRLKNCFVEYPGEPTRQDKSYYIIEDICGQFTKEFMENIIRQKLTKIEAPKVSTLYNCSYYLDEKRNFMLNLEYLNAQKQKTGNESMGRKVEQSSKIPMENLIVYQEDGPVNVIYLILGPEKFLSLCPNTTDVFTNDQLIQMADNLAENIKDYR